MSENRPKITTKGGRRISRTRSRQGRGTDSSSSEESGLSSDDDDDDRERDNQNTTSSSNHVNGSSLVASSLLPGRRASNFGLDEHGCISASPSAIEPQRPGSLGSGRGSTRRRGGVHSDGEEDGGSDHDGSGSSSRAPWESLLGLPGSVWEKLLSPSRSWHKRRYEVGINDLALIGWPVFVREDGNWRKQRRKKKKKPRAEWEGGELGHNEQADETQAEEGVVSPDLGASIASIADSLVSPTETPKRASMASAKAGKSADDDHDNDDPEDKDNMTMFNVVFVMDPPLLEYSGRIKEIYENIIKKFAKALKWEQARTGYVWKESQHILQVRRKARESNLINQSSLARAIYTVYTSISASKIASVSLSPDVSISLQIPPLTSTPYLAGPTDKAYPGLWLTTADSATPVDDPAADENNAPHQVLAKHFALLLLDSEASIIRDVEASGGTLAPALAHYIRCSKPTKSFAQISAYSGIPLHTIQMLASHLVYWRRARAIPPIHQRDTYIVSPNCDLSKLEVATIAYQTAFPTLPSLPKMLSALSGTPRPYGSFIPSKDHKETYFAILAWLLRGGWVTQLRTFARIKVTPEIKLAVEAALRKEEVDRYLAKGNSNSADTNDEDSASEDDTSSSSSSSLASHGSGDETPMPGRHDPHAQLRTSHKLLDRSTALRISSLILSPHRASPLESRWLDEIVLRFPDKPGPGQHLDGMSPDIAPKDLQTLLKKYWPVFLKYFNGSDALEKIPVRESLKRKLVWQVLTRLGFVTGPVGSLELDAREQVLVGVRHW
ncbi:hypothetical protein VI817_006518 [Penicillium citrinum]|nr:hypothetical protein VI817_006518 [Penicillium citrinum]